MIKLTNSETVSFGWLAPSPGLEHWTGKLWHLKEQTLKCNVSQRENALVVSTTGEFLALWSYSSWRCAALRPSLKNPCHMKWHAARKSKRCDSCFDQLWKLSYASGQLLWDIYFAHDSAKLQVKFDPDVLPLWTCSTPSWRFEVVALKNWLFTNCIRI